MSNKLDFIYDSETFVDLYSLLNADTEATSEEIRAIYLRLVKEHHPDHGGNSDMFQQITKAYEVLHNKETRKEYDLYYLKKSMDEYGYENEYSGNIMNRLKSDYKNFVEANVKPVSKEKLDEIYADIFKDRTNYTEKILEQDELKRRITDRDLERNTENIETQDDKLLNFMNEINKKSDIPITINDFFEYFKQKNKPISSSTDIIVGELGTLDTLPGYSSNYTSFVSETEYFGSNLYSNLDLNVNQENSENSENHENQDITSSIMNISIDDFNQWKCSKRNDNKLSQTELDKYLEKRKIEEQEILNEVETNLSISTKKKEVEKFLKTKHLSEEVDEYLKSKEPKAFKDSKERNMGNKTQDILEFMEQVKDNNITIKNPSGNEDLVKPVDSVETSKIEKTSNVRKREFK